MRAAIIALLLCLSLESTSLAQTGAPPISLPALRSVTVDPASRRIPRAPPDQAFYQRALTPILRDLGAEGARQWVAGERSGSVTFRTIENSLCRNFDLSEVRNGAASPRDAVTGQVCPGEDGAFRITSIRYVIAYDLFGSMPGPEPLPRYEPPLVAQAPARDAAIAAERAAEEMRRAAESSRAARARLVEEYERALAREQGRTFGAMTGGRQGNATPVIVEIGRAQPRVSANGGSAVALMTALTATQNGALCRELWNTTDTASMAQTLVGVRNENGVVQRLRPIYWLTSAGAPGADARPEARTCAARLASYDFNRAQVIRDKYGLTGAGPHLLVTRADEKAAAVINLEGRSDREIAGLVRFFRDGFAQEADVWSPERKPETFRPALVAALANDFQEGLLAGLNLILSPTARGGCTLGDLADTPCQP